MANPLLKFRDKLRRRLERAAKRRRKEKRPLRIARALGELDKYPQRPDAPKHGLPSQLIISLTSYPPRFDTLHLTLKSLLDQSIKPDRVILWIAEEDFDELPNSVLGLQDGLFRIERCANLRSFKKIIPALLSYPEAFIVTCDDDTFYPAGWLEGLVDSYNPHERSIVCYRAHRPRYSADGTAAPYRKWRHDAADRRTRSPSIDLYPTGNGGVLYPPHSLCSEATNMELVEQLTPLCDDMWLYFCRQRAGWSAKRVPGRRGEFIAWTGTQDHSLGTLLRHGKKDAYLQALSRHFGAPSLFR